MLTVCPVYLQSWNFEARNDVTFSFTFTSKKQRWIHLHLDIPINTVPSEVAIKPRWGWCGACVCENVGMAGQGYDVVMHETCFWEI